MRRRSSQSRYTRGNAIVAASLYLFAMGCASPGVPRPPSLHLPATVKDLSAMRVGNTVRLHFTAPEETTDHLPLTHKGSAMALTAVLCRVQGAACLEFARLRLLPGATADANDNLPPPLTVGQDRAIAYRVRVANERGRDAGPSRDALAVAGAAPEPLTGLTASTVATGIQLTWHAVPAGTGVIRIEATTTSPTAGPAFGKPPDTAQAKVRLLSVPDGGQDRGGAVDPTPPVGAHVRYIAYRERSFSGSAKPLTTRSAPAEISATRTADVFAPAAPRGLLAVAFQGADGKAAVSLSWDPNIEADVAGYRVYRAVDGGPFNRLTNAPVPGVSLQDTSGMRQGQHVRYAVTAVDGNGNESPRSAITEIDVR